MRCSLISAALFCLLFIQIAGIKPTEKKDGNPCPEDSLPCSSGECVKREGWCDEQIHCADGSDEAYCNIKGRFLWSSKNPNNCLEKHFLCKNGQCIPAVGQCDSFVDCKDKSDELSCEEPEEEDFSDYDEFIANQTSTTTAATSLRTDSTILEAHSMKSRVEGEEFSPTTQISSRTHAQEPPPPSTTSLPTKIPEQAGILSVTPKNVTSSPTNSFLETIGHRAPETAQSRNTSTTKSTTVVSRPRHPGNFTKPVPVLPNAYDSRKLPSTTLTSEVQPQRADHPKPLSGRTGSPTPASTIAPQPHNFRHGKTFVSSDVRKDTHRRNTQSPTRSYVAGTQSNTSNAQHHNTQTPRSLGERRSDSNNYEVHARNHYETRVDFNNQPTTQTPISYTIRRKSNQYQPSTTRFYNITPSSNQHLTPPTRPYDTKRNTLSYYAHAAPQYNTRQPNSNQQQSQPASYNQVPNQHNPYSSTSDAAKRVSSPQTRSSLQNSNLQAFETGLYTAEGFKIYRISSRSDSRFYEGYYDEKGRFNVLGSHGQSRPSSRQVPTQRSLGEPAATRPRSGDYRSNPAISNRRDHDTIHRRNYELAYYGDIKPSTSAPAKFDKKLKAPSRFNFEKNYARIYEPENRFNLEEGRQWILSVQNPAGGWGKDTPRALIALSLLNNSFVNGTHENDVMKKEYQVYLGTSLLRKEADLPTINRLAMSINALLATCQNPKDFFGTDLTELLQNQLKKLQQGHVLSRTTTALQINPLAYLSLCLADKRLTWQDEHDLTFHLNSNQQDEYSRDMLSLSISAFSCHLRQQNSSNSESYQIKHSALRNATTKLIRRMQIDGSFGSVYSTALAAQALFSLNDANDWDPEFTMEFLKERQKSDGSFGDFLATYLVLPVLSGRSLLHLRNTECTPPKIDRELTPQEILAYAGPKHHVKFTLYIGNPKMNGYSIEVLVPVGISFFDVMRVAAHMNDVFKFSYEERNGKIYVYSISNVPNDYERGLEWHVFAKRRTDTNLNEPTYQELIRQDIRHYFPDSDHHMIFWYIPRDLYPEMQV